MSAESIVRGPMRSPFWRVSANHVELYIGWAPPHISRVRWLPDLFFPSSFLDSRCRHSWSGQAQARVRVIREQLVLMTRCITFNRGRRASRGVTYRRCVLYVTETSRVLELLAGPANIENCAILKEHRELGTKQKKSKKVQIPSQTTLGWLHRRCFRQS